MFLSQDKLKPRHRPVNVVGTPNIPFGHKLKEPKKVLPHTKIPPTVTFLGEPKENEEEKKEFNKFLAKSAFIKNTDKKIARRKYFDCIEKGTKEYEEQLSKRREQLSKLLNEEQIEFEKLLEIETRKSASEEIQKMAKIKEEEEKREAENREKQVSAKRVQQYLTRCSQVREIFAKKSAFDTKFSNLVQAEEKVLRRNAEIEIESIWHDLNLKDTEERKLKEENEKRKRKEINSEVVANLDKQILEKMMAKEEEKREKEKERQELEKLNEEIRNEKFENLRKCEENRKKLKESLEEQLKIARRNLEKREEEEGKTNHDFLLLNEEKEISKQNSQILRNELLAFMRSMKEFRELEAKKSAEMDEIINKTAKEAEEKRNILKMQEKEAREREFQKTLQIRSDQIKENEERRKQEKLKKEQENKLFTELLKSHELAYLRKHQSEKEKAIRYSQELIAQKNQVKILRKREQEEIEERYKKDIEKEKEYEKMMQTLLNASNISGPCNKIHDSSTQKKAVKISKAEIQS